jgi:hypothetical protein
MSAFRATLELRSPQQERASHQRVMASPPPADKERGRPGPVEEILGGEPPPSLEAAPMPSRFISGDDEDEDEDEDEECTPLTRNQPPETSEVLSTLN